MGTEGLPIPAHFDPGKVDRVWKVPYQELATKARNWAATHAIRPAARDRGRIFLLLVDVQNTFCIPDFELYVGGVSGTGAVDDNRRLCEFIYRNLDQITEIGLTMDTHQAVQIFHSIFLVDSKGEHPPPYAMITVADIEQEIWRFNPELSTHLNIDAAYGQDYLLHYTRQLKAGGKYDLTVWPYHAMLGGIGHALVSSVEEAVFFHSMARFSQPDFQIKGSNPFTENYSVLRPEVQTDSDGKQIATDNTAWIQKLLSYDSVIVAGQAKSHCVAWTIEDLLGDINHMNPELARKVYLLEDGSSPVVIPGIIDYSDQADQAYQRFATAGMHIVRSTDPIRKWPGMALPG